MIVAPFGCRYFGYLELVSVWLQRQAVSTFRFSLNLVNPLDIIQNSVYVRV